jgi:thioredoxin-related protein
MKKIVLISLVCFFSVQISAQEKTRNSMLEPRGMNVQEKADKEEGERIEWMSFEEAVEANKSNPKKFLIDVYTDWCGWCKKMDRTTFQNPEVVSYVNKKYHAVKLNAERKDTVKLDDKVFVNENPGRKRNPHQLAISLMNGKMSYPTIVYLDEQGNMLQPIAGFQDAESIMPIINFFGENAYKNTSWEEYQKEY